ncbi:DUF554 domain-containing protein [Niameybacter massiliensis]|uniref:DUF554 domain-containing protein n=1 Tax=Holtiella tumoricola TaxID=3018743 RepID=A0AA42DPV2_9FIRM|nr:MULTISPECIES: DUF554 domain-containing protein [Lachnospirales]MDA3732975.1 DUF554 domain-containing protein [Holtiella tumoricola]
MLGTIVNVLLILVGSILGILLKRGIEKRYEDLIMSALGLVTAVIGITFAIKSQNMLIVVVSLVIGALIGEWIDIDSKLNKVGDWLKDKVKGKGGTGLEEESRIGEGFVTATLLFCVGSMAIMGALDSGLRGDHTILYTKSIMDGISALIFASSMGIGVALSAFPILIYQGGIALMAQTVQPYLSDAMMIEMNAVGGILLIGIGLSLLDIKRIKVSNLLPALIIPIIWFLIVG